MTITLKISDEKRTILTGQNAIDLWLQGRGAWNAWVKDNPEADIDVSDADFSAYRDKCINRVISFEGYIFPNGLIFFDGATFGDGEVSFVDVVIRGHNTYY